MKKILILTLLISITIICFGETIADYKIPDWNSSIENVKHFMEEETDFHFVFYSNENYKIKNTAVFANSDWKECLITWIGDEISYIDYLFVLDDESAAHSILNFEIKKFELRDFKIRKDWTGRIKNKENGNTISILKLVDIENAIKISLEKKEELFFVRVRFLNLKWK